MSFRPYGKFQRWNYVNSVDKQPDSICDGAVIGEIVNGKYDLRNPNMPKVTSDDPVLWEENELIKIIATEKILLELGFMQGKIPNVFLKGNVALLRVDYEKEGLSLAGLPEGAKCAYIPINKDVDALDKMELSVLVEVAPFNLVFTHEVQNYLGGFGQK